MPSDFDLVLFLFMQVNYCEGKARKRTSNNIIKRAFLKEYFSTSKVLFYVLTYNPRRPFSSVCKSCVRTREYDEQ